MDADVAGWGVRAAGRIGGTGFGCPAGLDHAVLEGQRGLCAVNRDWCQLDVPVGWGRVLQLLIQDFLLLQSVKHLRNIHITALVMS